MATNKEWGPPLWRLLHGLTESLGKQTIAFLSADEAHEIVFILRDVEKVLPCSLCRKHYHQWRKDHPIELIANLRGPALREAVRKWLYDLHENVNQSKNIESGITIDMLHDVYESVDIRTEWGHFLTKIKLSTEIGLVSPTVLTNFHRHVGTLRKLIGR